MVVAVATAFLSGAAAAQSPPRPAPAGAYERMKSQIEDETGVRYSMNVSVLTQLGAPGGTYAVTQAMFTPNVDWKAFDDPGFGAGSFQFHYLAVHYWTVADAGGLAARLDLNTPLNAYPTDTKFFRQVSYTHRLPGDWLTVTLGQYPFASFDGNAYANDQQVGFISNSMSQNGSQNYSKASLGAYGQVEPSRNVAFAAGVHEGQNLTGHYIQFDKIGQGPYAWFLYGAWSPDFGSGRGSYALFYYSLPSVPAQPRGSDGLSFSASQPLGERWGVFLRANTAWNSSFAVQSSVALGAVLNDPLGRSTGDRIGIGVAWNRTNASLYSATSVRPSETMVELYWNWTVGRRLLLTPDIQWFLQPALTPQERMAAVFSLRLTQQF